MLQGVNVRVKPTESLQPGAVDVFICGLNGSQLMPFQLQSLESVDINLDNAKVEHACTLDERAAQQLADDLWMAGIRPSKRPDAGELLRCKDQHIGDLRAALMLALGEGK